MNKALAYYNYSIKLNKKVFKCYLLICRSTDN